MENIEIENHPWKPFIPAGARILIMGTFPPQAKRWNMDFYYPNRTNDFWKIMGLIFLHDKDALLLPESKDYDLEKIINLMTQKHIALNDTVRKARRLKGNASDKFLEIIEPVPLFSLLEEMPECRALASTGEKAAIVVSELTQSPIPAMGEKVIATPEELSFPIDIFRMPSTSRAYPLAVEKKAEYYRKMFEEVGII
ncbi:MAG: uracil-DNA glycosylase family protein [Muribaculaceae bacterium]|nr:uracil-DNA glycosylase family protein [Muribaculaceae bacterium]